MTGNQIERVRRNQIEKLEQENLCICTSISIYETREINSSQKKKQEICDVYFIKNRKYKIINL